MAEIYKIVKELRTNMGTHKVGERMFKEPQTIGLDGFIYYSENGGYPIWDKQIPMEDYAEYVESTDKHRSYYTSHIYTQE